MDSLALECNPSLDPIVQSIFFFMVQLLLQRQTTIVFEHNYVVVHEWMEGHATYHSTWQRFKQVANASFRLLLLFELHVTSIRRNGDIASVIDRCTLLHGAPIAQL